MAAGSGISAGTLTGLGVGAAALVVAGVVYFSGKPPAPEPAVQPAQVQPAPAPAAVEPAPEVKIAAADPAATAVPAIEPAPAVEPAATGGDAAAEPAVEAAATVEPVVAEPAPAAAPEPAAADEPAVAAPVEQAAPSVLKFDVVRVEPDGSATVAGQAAPGEKLSLRLDGAEVATAQADAQGKFATLFSLSASSMPRLLALVAIADSGSERVGEQTVAIAPTVAALPAAAAEEPAAPAETVAAAAPAAILVAPEGVKVVQPAAAVPAEVAANVGIDSIAYAPDGAVNLGGHGQGAAPLRLYLDGAALAETAVGPDGLWALQLPDVAPGLYTLRVDQLGADGKVVSRFETPFKRETLAALAAAAAPAAAPAPAAPKPAPTAPAAAPAAAPEEPAAPVASEVVAAAPVAPAADAAAGADPVVAEVAPAVPAAPAAIDAAPAAQAVAQAPSIQPAPVTVTVQPGFTLWGIAESRYGEGVLYVQVFDANKDKIKDPDLIYPGQILTVPASD